MGSAAGYFSQGYTRGVGNIYLGYYSIIAAIILIVGSFLLVIFKHWYNDRQTTKHYVRRLLTLNEAELKPNGGKSLVDKVDKQGRQIEYQGSQIEEIYCILKGKKPVEIKSPPA